MYAKRKKTTCVFLNTVQIEGPCYEPDAAYDATHENQRRSCIGRKWIKGNEQNIEMEGIIQLCDLYITQQATGR